MNNGAGPFPPRQGVRPGPLAGSVANVFAGKNAAAAATGRSTAFSNRAPAERGPGRARLQSGAPLEGVCEDGSAIVLESVMLLP